MFDYIVLPAKICLHEYVKKTIIYARSFYTEQLRLSGLYRDVKT
jgi:hypothetical protein